ncbi:GGDEF domain-containing protein [Amphritea sp. HPY]|uniref:GGDEF domain-containing protein n=1 Tax=Amphritea sp. HPY TaxID=3421652 RepID=UPI003D7DA46B
MIWQSRPTACGKSCPTTATEQEARSIGVAIYPNYAGTMEDTIKAADEALYLEKENGRDRAEVSRVSVIEKTEDKPTLEIESE